MPIRIQWDNDEKTILRYVYEGSWDLKAFYQVYDEARKMIETVDHQVDFIIDVTDSSLIPSGVLSQGRTVTTAPHPNEGRTIIVGASSLIKSVFSLFRRIYGGQLADGKYNMASTLEEAHAMLSGSDNAG